MTNDDLKPCPFCGNSAKFDVIRGENDPGFTGEYVVCMNLACGASTNLMFPDKEDVKPLLAAKWNRRSAAGEGGEQVSQTKTPPWESAKQYSQCTDIEKVFLWVWVETHHDIHKPTIERAWSELCALRAVAEAAEHAMRIDLDLNSFCLCDECDEGETCMQCRLRAGLAEWRAICPRNVV